MTLGRDSETSKLKTITSHIWKGTKRALNQKSFNPHNRISANFTADMGILVEAILSTFWFQPICKSEQASLTKNPTLLFDSNRWNDMKVKEAYEYPGFTEAENSISYCPDVIKKEELGSSQRPHFM